MKIEINDLRISPGGRDILLIPQLHVASGDVLAVLGPNGAGKSTLIETLLGFRRISGGTVDILGHKISSGGSGDLTGLRRRIGYVAQGLAITGEMPLTVREVVAVGRTGLKGLFRRLTRGDWVIVDEWIDSLGLGEIATRRYSDCSGGEQRKTLIARAMVQLPEILMLDEPMANLDIAWRERLLTVLEDIYARTGLTIIMVCHEFETIPQCTSKVLLLDGGRVAACGKPAEVLTSELLGGIFGCRVRRLDFLPCLADDRGAGE